MIVLKISFSCLLSLTFLTSMQSIFQDMEVPNSGRSDKAVVLIYTMEYYSAIKKNKILLFPRTWMDLGALC